MLETLFYVPVFKAFPELSLLIFLIIKDIWDLPFKENIKLPQVFVSETGLSIFPGPGAPEEQIAPEDQSR